ncbi:fungal-specific transcription factor domain-containing protein [Hypoxylon sp. FL1857]|nr:fungal-specific transcription factor domain-containing protein [Hypoxylon sp. FL1857]
MDLKSTLFPPEVPNSMALLWPLSNIPEIIGRIERLESIVLQHNSANDHPENAVDSHHSSLLTFTSISDDVTASNVNSNREEDSLLLENVATRDDAILPSLSHGLAVRISSTRAVFGARTPTQHHPTALDDNQANNHIVTFPTYTVATLLFQSFESNLEEMCRILHIPTIRSLMKTFYLRLNQSEKISLGQAALLLSIFALSAFFYQPSETSEVAVTGEDAVNISKALGKGALDVLDHSRRNTSGTLEDVQAYILMSFVVFHLDGFSARGRLLLTTAASVARDLRLHRLDADGEYSTANVSSLRRSIDFEIKRRVFWHIVTEDWLHSTISGPQEGMYFVHPNHINVGLPKDCFDDDITLEDENEPITKIRPNGMAFFLERARLAHLCRELADIVPLETSKLLQMPYDTVIALDKKLGNFLSSLPFFFKLDAESREQSKALETVYPQIPVMRYSIANAAHSRRFKLHQKFLLRQSYDPRFVYSRKACLESARAIIQGYDAPRGYNSPSYVTARMGIAMHYTHLALVVLVMDLCFNKDETDEAEIKAEVKAAFQRFEDARDISPLPGRFLGSLRNILQKHKVYLTDPPDPITHDVTGFTDEIMPDSFNLPEIDRVQFNEPSMGINEPEAIPDISFDEFWHFASHGEPNPDSFTWDSLFSSLDARPI